MKIASTTLLLTFAAMWGLMDNPQRKPYQLWLQEDFKYPTSRQFWTVSPNWRTRGIELIAGKPKSGIQFQARTTRPWQSDDEFAIADWEVGTSSFHFDFVVQIDHARLQKYFEAGMALVLCGKPPSEMTERDLSIVVQISYAGIGMAVWRGWFLSPEARQISSTTYDVNGLESVAWHMQFLADTQVTCTVERHGNDLSMSVNSNSVPDMTPWKKETFQLNDSDTLDLRKIIVQRVPVKPEHIGYPAFDFNGRITRMAGYSLVNAPPQVASLSLMADSEVPELELRGSNLGNVTNVRVGHVPDFEPTIQTQESIRVPIDPNLLTGDSLRLVLSVGEQHWQSELPNPAITQIDSVSPTEISPSGDRITLSGRALSKSVSAFVGETECIVLSQTDSKLVVQTPELEFGNHTVRLVTNGAKRIDVSSIAVGRHPRLLWDEQRKASLTRRFADPSFNVYASTIRQQANAGNVLSQILLAKLADDETAFQELMAAIRVICKKRDAITFDATNWANVAITYDTLFERLEPEDRNLLRSYLTFVLDRFDQAHDDWFFAVKHNPSNTVAVANSGGGLVALALLDTIPKAQQLAERARNRLSQFIQATVRSDGGYNEGTLYWNYAMTEYLRFLTAWRNSELATPDNDADTNLAKMPQYVDAVLGGDGCMVTFNDTQPWLTGLPVIAFLGCEYQLDRLDQMADFFVDKCGDDAALAFLLRSDQDFRPTMPSLPKNTVLPATQLATFRSESEWSKGGVLSLFGATNRMSHHEQEDQGSLIYSLNGNRVLIDPGYYLPKAEHHSVLIINGTGPTAGIPSRIRAANSDGTTHFISMDLTQAYQASKTGDVIKSTSRQVLMHGQEFVVVDEVELLAPNTEFEFVEQLQLANVPTVITEATGTTVRIPDDGDDSADIRFFGDDWVTDVEGPCQFKDSWIFRRLAERKEILWHSIRLSRKLRSLEPAVWCLTSPAGTMRIDLQKDHIQCRFSDGATLLLSRTPEGWNWQPN